MVLETRLNESKEETIHSGKDLQNRLVEGPVPVPLTPSEFRILCLFEDKLNTPQEVADYLVVSKRTVDFHLTNIYNKYRCGIDGTTNLTSTLRVFRKDRSLYRPDQNY